LRSASLIVLGAFAADSQAARMTTYVKRIPLKAYKTQVNVMAPLGRIHDWNTFKTQLATLKNAGVTGLTTDIWWGEFESRGDNQFDWSYYQHYARVLSEAGLEWIPILSFHQCGGNVGDDCNIPLPS